MTVQAIEPLVYKAEQLHMRAMPLDIYLEQNNIRFEVEPTAHWRGQTYYWGIKRSDELVYRLYLVGTV